MDGYRFFDVSVLERQCLSSSLRRFVLGGEALDQISHPAPDLYLKVFFPSTPSALAGLPRGEDWYARYLAQPSSQRLPMRTFTVRAVEPSRSAVVIDFALHGDQGPASCWAQRAGVGDALVLYAPLQARWGRGYTWRLPPEAERIWLLADECGLPAAAAIIESLSQMASGVQLTALLEVPEVDYQLPLPLGQGAEVYWYPRHLGRRQRAYGDALQAALAASLGRPLPRAVDNREAGEMPIWELAVPGGGADYVWMAAEAGLVSTLRRQWIDAGLARQAISCMGYWRRGRAQS